MLRSLHKRCTPRRKRAINQMRFQRLTRGSNLASNPGAPAVSLHKSSGSAPLPRPLVKGNASRRAGLAHADATQADPLPRLASRRRISLAPAKPRRARNRMRRRCDRQPERQRPGRSAPPRRRKSRPANARPSQNRGAGNICDADEPRAFACAASSTQRTRGPRRRAAGDRSTGSVPPPHERPCRGVTPRRRSSCPTNNDHSCSPCKEPRNKLTRGLTTGLFALRLCP